MSWNLDYSNVCLFYSLVCVEIFSLSPSYSYIYITLAGETRSLSILTGSASCCSPCCGVPV